LDENFISPSRLIINFLKNFYGMDTDKWKKRTLSQKSVLIITVVSC
jgi:hypothetical protein